MYADCGHRNGILQCFNGNFLKDVTIAGWRQIGIGYNLDLLFIQVITFIKMAGKMQLSDNSPPLNFQNIATIDKRKCENYHTFIKSYVSCQNIPTA